MSDLSGDWFRNLGLVGSEGVISAFVAHALSACSSARGWLIESASKNDVGYVLSADAADDAGWSTSREWFVANKGNVDVVLRNRARGYTFLVEHKIDTRLSTRQISKYLEVVGPARRAISPSEIVVPCMLTPIGHPHAQDLAQDPEGLRVAVQVGYSGLLDRVRGERALAAQPYQRCMDEMERLVRTAITANLDSRSSIDARLGLVARIRARLGLPAGADGTLRVVAPSGWIIKVPSGPRQCITITPPANQSGPPSRPESVPWPEPGLDAPWSADLANLPHRDELLDEQALLVEKALRAGESATTSR